MRTIDKDPRKMVDESERCVRCQTRNPGKDINYMTVDGICCHECFRNNYTVDGQRPEQPRMMNQRTTNVPLGAGDDWEV